MTRAEAGEARKVFPTPLSGECKGKDRKMLHRRGKALGAIGPMENLELLPMLEERTRRRRAEP